MEGIKNRLKAQKGKISQLEDIAIETIQKKKKKTDKNEQNFCGINLSSLISSGPDFFWNYQWSNIYKL